MTHPLIKKITWTVAPIAKFPLYRSHREVCCFKCEQLLDHREMFDTDHAPADGHYGQHCRACNMTTFYDIVGTSNRPSDLLV